MEIIKSLADKLNISREHQLIAVLLFTMALFVTVVVLTFTNSGDQLATTDQTGQQIEGSRSNQPQISATTLLAGPTTQNLDNSTHSGHNHSGDVNNANLEPFRNDNPAFSRFTNVPSNQLSISALTVSGPSDNGPGPGGEAQFRARCHFSHLAYDDPIVHPGQPGASHLHMFYGNTGVDGNTTDESLVNSGGGSCQGFELNRTGYWMPALLDGDNNVRVPDNIDMYYKTRNADQVVKYPQGLKMIAGAPNSRSLGWQCSDGTGGSYPAQQIPDNCPNSRLKMSVIFPDCWDGRLDSDDHMSHLYATAGTGSEQCPASHPQRLVEFSINVYWSVGGEDLRSWKISSDEEMGGSRGSSLHADWYGGWNETVQDTWFNNCIKSVKGCSLGQTGTPQQLALRGPGESYPNGVGDGNYSGPKIIDIGL